MRASSCARRSIARLRRRERPNRGRARVPNCQWSALGRCCVAPWTSYGRCGIDQRNWTYNKPSRPWPARLVAVQYRLCKGCPIEIEKRGGHDLARAKRGFTRVNRTAVEKTEPKAFMHSRRLFSRRPARVSTSSNLHHGNFVRNRGSSHSALGRRHDDLLRRRELHSTTLIAPHPRIRSAYWSALHATFSDGSSVT